MAAPREAILDLCTAVNAAESLDEILRTVIRRIAELMPHDRASVALLDAEAHQLEIRELVYRIEVGGTGEGERGKRMPVDESTVLGWVLIHQQPHLRSSLDQPYPFETVQVTRQAASHMVAPLLGRREALGVITVGSYQEHAFDQQDLEIFCQYARLTAVAIENLRSYQGARELAVRDPLTGAFNRRQLLQVLDQELYRTERYGGALSLLMLDVDRFKRLNDRFGHPAGDHLLRQTTALVRNRLRQSDQIFRYGGEEFTVLLPATGPDQALAVADELVALLRSDNRYRPPHGGEEVAVTVSIGVASYPEDAATREALIACADQALYRAKRDGRDRAVAFSQLEELHAAAAQLRAAGTDAEGLPEAPEVGSREGLREHSHRVVELVEMLGAEMHLAPGQRQNLKIAALYHDIGELGIPRGVLDKPGPLDAGEREVVETHPVVGENVVRRAFRVREILLAILFHHERWDGRGYPSGLAGEEIPLAARMLAVAETFDALVTERPYRRPRPVEEGYRVLREAAGQQLDPELVEHFIRAHEGRR